VDILALTFGAGDLGFLVFLEGKNTLEGLSAIFTIVFIAGHGNLPQRYGQGLTSVYSQGRRVSRRAKEVAEGGVGGP